MVKKLSVLLLAGCSIQAMADSLAVVVGVQSWQAKSDLSVTDSLNKTYRADDDQNQQALYLKFEHPLPLLPNFALRQQRLDHQTSQVLAADLRFGAQQFTSGQTVSATLGGRWQDLTAYYELADNDLLQLDLGLTVRRLDSSLAMATASTSAQQQIDRWRPMLFADVELAILGTDTAIFGQLAYGKASSDHSRDLSAGFAWRWLDITALQGYLKLGYQDVRLDLAELNTTDTVQSLRGAFVALEFDF